MKLALAQTAPLLGDVAGNLKRHREMIRKARARKAGLVVFPELSLTGYHLQDLVYEVAEGAEDGPGLRSLAAASRGCGIIAGFAERGEGHQVHNSAACWVGGSLAHVHRKVHLPTYGMFDEGRDFAPGGSFRTFDAPWGRTGLLICEDFWHLASSWVLSVQGMELLVVISASPVKGLGRGKRPASLAIWEELGRVTARHLTCHVAYVNRVGFEEGWAFQGGSYLCAPDGRMVARAGILEEELLVAELSGPALRSARIRSPLSKDARPDVIRRELGRVLGGAPTEGEG